MQTKINTIKNIKRKMTYHPIIFYNVRNLNDRQYSFSNIQKLLPDFKSRVQRGWDGELGHPNDYNAIDKRIIHLSNVSHQITDLINTPKYLLAKIKINNTDNGKILKKLIDKKLAVFRPRAIGAFSYDKIIDVLDIISIDAIPINDDSFFNTQKSYDRNVRKFN